MNYKLFLPIFLIKRVSSTKVYLQGLFPVLGLIHLIRTQKLSVFYLYLVGMLIISGLFSLVKMEAMSIVRLGQVFCLIGFSHFFADHFSRKDVLNFLKISVVLGIIANFVYYFFLGDLFQKAYKAFLPGLSSIKTFGIFGLIGEPNFTSIFFIVSSFIFLHNKNKLFYVLSLLLIIPTGSRSGLLGIFLSLLYFGLNFNKSILKWVSRVAIALLVSYPLVLVSVGEYSSPSTLKRLNDLSSGRIGIQLNYMKLFKDNIWGVGFFQGRKHFTSITEVTELDQLVTINGVDQKKKVILVKGLELPVFGYEQHSAFIQIISEFGVLGYLLWSIFLFAVLERLLKVDYMLSYFFACLAAVMLQLNSLNEIALYIYLGYCLQVLRTQRPELVTEFNLKDVIDFIKQKVGIKGN